MAVRVKLNDLSKEQKDTIRKHLLMQPEDPSFFAKKRMGRFTSSKDPIMMYYIDKPNNEIVLPYTFANSLMNCHINSYREYPAGKYNFINTTLRPHQVPIVNTAMEHLITKGTTTIGAPPGAGKTLMSAWLASQLEGLVLVVSPLTLVQRGWISTFEQYTDAGVWINNGKNPCPSQCNVILTMDTMFIKIPKEILLMVKTLIIDEAHMFCTPNRIHCLLGSTPRYIIACTATPKRTDKMEQIMQSVCGVHGIFIKPTKQYTVYKLLTGISVEIEKNKSGDSNWPKLVKDLAEHTDRNNLILDLVKRNLSYKIMILTWNKKHAHFLSNLFRQHEISSDVLAGNKSTYKDSKVLVATFAKSGVGFDEAVACADWNGIRLNMMILTGSTKNVNSLCQFVGRIFRSEHPIIIDMVDNISICKRHWTQRKKWYSDPEQNGTIYEIKYEANAEQNKIKSPINTENGNHIPSKMLERAKKLAQI